MRWGFSISKVRTAVLIDGGHVRALARVAKHTYNPDFIEKVAHACVGADEALVRVLYYDCALFSGTVKLPVSGQDHEFKASDRWLHQLAAKDLFAVRQGVLKFRGWKPRKTPVAAAALTDADFTADFEQKGVDMRIGLDMATFSEQRSVERIILVSGDTDCVPAMKHARKAGLQIVLIAFPNGRDTPELLWHSDFHRRVAWPAK
ncbi:MAG: NYN domain-containing protein [Sphingomonas sp.]|uniref:NYN domain-containing protein n=1 Tax=Sphingomonas sp. TaxID=28214 RepID=UPI001AD3DEB7|nr:NYN domain-containing protein [Sphingomonas sp.]MBN8816969.1 NYN domain-containing protein [Sphingomonas sp.]